MFKDCGNESTIDIIYVSSHDACIRCKGLMEFQWHSAGFRIFTLGLRSSYDVVLRDTFLIPH